MRRTTLLALPIAALLALAACSQPPPERLSEDAKQAREASELREHIQEPLDKAKAVEDVSKQQAEDQAAAIEDQGG